MFDDWENKCNGAKRKNSFCLVPHSCLLTSLLASPPWSKKKRARQEYYAGNMYIYIYVYKCAHIYMYMRGMNFGRVLIKKIGEAASVDTSKQWIGKGYQVPL